MESPRFNRIFVVEPSHDFSALKPFCQEIVFLTTGYETANQLTKTIAHNLYLQKFDPEMDAVLPVGRVVACVVTGIILGRSHQNKSIWLGTYSREEGYRFMKESVR